MLKLLNSIDRVKELIPNLRQQLNYLEEHEKLFHKSNVDLTLSYDSLSNKSAIPKPAGVSSTNFQSSSVLYIDSTVSDSNQAPHANLISTISVDSSKLDQTIATTNVALSFPDEYQVPLLPKALMKDIDAGILSGFRPHFQGRQILIDTVVHDLMENYNLL